MNQTGTLNDLLIELFYTRRSYGEILARLKHVHGIERSMAWLKRKFKHLHLRRRGCLSPEATIRVLILHMLESSECLRGYRAIWQLIQERYHISVPRHTVSRILKELDPSGVAGRRRGRLQRRVYHSKGPSYLWHADGYDKLAPYGIRVHGCIDGYSRKILWLQVTPTNHNPSVILHFYLNAVASVGGCPKVLRCDYGTENRIEGWWSQFRRHKSEWWISFCKELEMDRLFDPDNELHRFTLAYVIVPLFTREVEDFVRYWNGHRIRPSAYGNSPGGIPDDLFAMPEYFRVRNHLQPVSSIAFQLAIQRSEAPPPFYSREFGEWADSVLSLLGLTHNHIAPSNCRAVYITFFIICSYAILSNVTLGVEVQS